jgi:hypothetical protein
MQIVYFDGTSLAPVFNKKFPRHVLRICIAGQNTDVHYNNRQI